MFINSIPVDIVGGAYDIAANYIKSTGLIPPETEINLLLFDSIVEDFRGGKTNKLILGNRAIARFEKANGIVEIAS